MDGVSVISVTELNLYVKQLIAGSNFLASVTVRGEISNFTNHIKTGHMYMSLKDEGSVIRAIMFAGSAKNLRFMPENGMKVIVTGRVAVFERDGQYQLYISDMQPDGIGALQIAFEQLKNRLAEEGLFEQWRKKPLPKIPMRIGVITSPTGAAVRDIINILGRRFPLSKIVICPVLVQGENAAPQLVKAVELFNKRDLADLLIIGRGGGSIEELWAFNEEIVARAVAASKIPIISAVGHETDFTICDFAADLRAPTPSAAAEIAVPSVLELKKQLKGFDARLSTALLNFVQKKKIEAQRFNKSRIAQNPKLMIDDRRMQVTYAVRNVISEQRLIISKLHTQFGKAAVKLDALSPLTTLSRGYLIAEKDGGVIKTAKDLKPGDTLELMLCDGNADCTVQSVNLKEN